MSLQLIDNIHVLHPLSVSIYATKARVSLAAANLTLEKAVINGVLHRASGKTAEDVREVWEGCMWRTGQCDALVRETSNWREARVETQSGGSLVRFGLMG